jgi:hypothetical protein
LMPSCMLRNPCSCSSREDIPCEPSPSTFSLWCSWTLFRRELALHDERERKREREKKKRKKENRTLNYS